MHLLQVQGSHILGWNFKRTRETSIFLGIISSSKDLDQEKLILKWKYSLCFYTLLESVANSSVLDLVMLVTGWWSDVNRSKEGETGRSECEVTKTRYLEAEELREIWDLSWKISFQNKLGHVVCIILILVLRRSLLTSLLFFFFSGTQFRSNQMSHIASSSSWLPYCAQLFSLIYPEKVCSLRQTLLAAYKMIYSLLLFQNWK